MPADPPTSHLFILRLWSEELDDGRLEWRGKLQHPQTNQTRHFRDWPALVPLLLALIRLGEETDLRESAGTDDRDAVSGTELGEAPP